MAQAVLVSKIVDFYLIFDHFCVIFCLFRFLASQQGITTGGGDTFLAERAAHAYMEGTKPFVTKCKEAEHHPTTKAKPEKNNTEVEHEIKRRHEKEKYGFSNKMPHTK